MGHRQLQFYAVIFSFIVFAAATAGAGTPAQITNCAEIKAPGLYIVPNPFKAATTGDCIVIKASNVLLNLNNSEMTGIVGSLAGIHVMPQATNVFIEGEGTSISGFTNGVEIEGNGNSIERLFTEQNLANGVWLHRATNASVSRLFSDHNGVAGLLLDHGNHNRIAALTASQNGEYGLWLEGSSGNVIDGFDLEGNSVELYLGCSPSGPAGAKCKPGPQSSNNRIFGGSGSLLMLGFPQFGLAIDSGSVGNRVIGTDFRNNNTRDLIDENPNCATNLWFANDFALADPACIQ